ncbi:MAG: TerB N-terminal domain-containing protein [Ruminococcus sp.]
MLPTASYATLTDKQLTAYFIWRTKVRQGNYPFAIPAFIAIYAFELLNQIGVSDSMDGLQKLQALKNAYCHETERFPGVSCHSSGAFPAMDRQLHHLLRALPRPAQRGIPQREVGCHADAAALGRRHTGGTVRHPVRLRLLRTQPFQVLPSLSGGRADGHLPHFSGAVAVLRKVPEKRSVSCTFSKKGA